ncbi:MAG: hypothetical protein WBB67_09225 [bacterium]
MVFAITFLIAVTCTHELEMTLDRARTTQDMTLFYTILEHLEIKYPHTIHFSHLPPARHLLYNPDFSSMRWGDDILVDSCYSYQSVSIDARSDSVLFIAASRQVDVDDTAHIDIRFSSDGGNTWAWFAAIGSSGYPYDLVNPSLEVVEADDSVYLFITYEAEPLSNPSDGFIGIWRFNFNTMTDTAFYVSDLSGVDEADPDIDADDIQYSYAPYLYCTWESSDSIIFARSVNRGKDWSERYVLKGGNAIVDYYNPNCTFGWYDPGADSLTIGICWEYYHSLSGQKRIWYSFNWAYGHSFAWSASKFFVPPTGCLEYAACIKSVHQATGAVITFGRRDTLLGLNSVVCKYTFDDDVWFESILDSSSSVSFFPSLGVDDSCGRFHLCYNSIANAFYTNAPYDSLEQAGWLTPYRINGNTINDSIPIATAVLLDLPMACWVEYGSTIDYLVFDALWNVTYITEENSEDKSRGVWLAPNPSKRVTKLFCDSPQSFYMSVEIFDVCGRSVKRCLCKRCCGSTNAYEIELDGLLPGIYFVQTDVGRAMQPLKLVIAH